MFRSKLKSLFNPDRMWVKVTLLVFALVVLVAILAVAGSMLMPDAELPVSLQIRDESRQDEPKSVDEITAQTPAAEGQFESPKTLTNPEEIDLADQVIAAAATRGDVMAFTLFNLAVDHIDYSKDGNRA